MSKLAPTLVTDTVGCRHWPQHNKNLPQGFKLLQAGAVAYRWEEGIKLQASLVPLASHLILAGFPGQSMQRSSHELVCHTAVHQHAVLSLLFHSSLQNVLAKLLQSQDLVSHQCTQHISYLQCFLESICVNITEALSGIPVKCCAHTWSTLTPSKPA